MKIFGYLHFFLSALDKLSPLFFFPLSNNSGLQKHILPLMSLLQVQNADMSHTII